MTNGKAPKTDREWLMQIDSKIEGLSEDIKQQRSDTVGIFNRLRTVELDAEKRTGQCKVHLSETNTLADKLDKIPNVSRVIRQWGAGLVIVQVILASLLLAVKL